MRLIQVGKWWAIVALLLMFATPIGVAVGGMAINLNVCDIENSSITELYSGYNSNDIGGHFFLGSGTVNEKDMVYYWINNNGILSKHQRGMDESVFIEDGKNIMVEKSLLCPNNLQWLFIEPGLYQVEFHVPEGSVAQMYQYQ